LGRVFGWFFVFFFGDKPVECDTVSVEGKLGDRAQFSQLLQGIFCGVFIVLDM
jgi:hypothetical protein